MTLEQPEHSPEQILAAFEADVTSRYPHRRMKTIADAIPLLEAQGLKDKAQQARWEAMLFSLHRRESGQEEALGGRFGPAMVIEGRRTADLPDFPDEAWAYFESRVQASQNPILRSWYGDALWEKKHNHLDARAAIQARRDCYSLYVRNEWWQEAADALIRAMKLAARLNDRPLFAAIEGDALSALLRFVGTRSHPQVRWCLAIIDALLISGKFLGDDDLEAILGISHAGEGFYLSVEGGQDHYLARSFGERTAQALARLKRPTDVAAVKQRIGAIWEMEAEMKGANDNLLGAMILEKAIEHYANIGQSAKVEELKVKLRGKYGAALEKNELKAITTEVSIP